jgi:hypothetical protein
MVKTIALNATDINNGRQRSAKVACPKLAAYKNNGKTIGTPTTDKTVSQVPLFFFLESIIN